MKRFNEIFVTDVHIKHIKDSDFLITIDNLIKNDVLKNLVDLIKQKQRLILKEDIFHFSYGIIDKDLYCILLNNYFEKKLFKFERRNFIIDEIAQQDINSLYFILDKGINRDKKFYPLIITRENYNHILNKIK